MDETLGEQNSLIKKKSKSVTLSARQRQVIDLVVSGMAYKEIAHELKISENTVAYHMRVIRLKLGCKNSRGIIPAAIKSGINLAT